MDRDTPPDSFEPDGAYEADADTIVMAKKTISGDLRGFVLDQLRHNHKPLPWDMRPEAEQREIVQAVERACEAAVTKAVRLIAADGRRVMTGTLDSVTVKDGFKAVIKLAAHDPLRHALVDSAGQQVLIVVSDAEEYLGERGPAEIKKDQPPLFDDGDLPPDEDPPVFDQTASGKAMEPDQKPKGRGKKGGKKGGGEESVG